MWLLQHEALCELTWNKRQVNKTSFGMIFVLIYHSSFTNTHKNMFTRIKITRNLEEYTQYCFHLISVKS